MAIEFIGEDCNSRIGHISGKTATTTIIWINLIMVLMINGSSKYQIRFTVTFFLEISLTFIAFVDLNGTATTSVVQ